MPKFASRIGQHSKKLDGHVAGLLEQLGFRWSSMEDVGPPSGRPEERSGTFPTTPPISNNSHMRFLETNSPKLVSATCD